MEPTKITIEGRAALKGIVLAAALSVVGMLVVAAGSYLNWGQTAGVLGFALAGVGAGMVLVSQEAARKAGCEALLTDEGYIIDTNRAHVEGPWSEVRRVTMSGNTIAVQRKDNTQLSIIAPPGARPGQMDALADALATRLDASRGYRPFE